MSADGAFGIDHPLIAVRDIVLVRARLGALGFDMTPPGHHPWGTSTSLAVFANCLLEIVGIEDESRLDEKPAGDFRFGRHVSRFLAEREGVALTALHSRDTAAEVERAREAGLEIAGTIEFGRDVVLPDGTLDRTRTTLALLPDVEHERLSFFLCRQHRRDLVEVPGWMAHPNRVLGIDGVTVLAEIAAHERLTRRLGALYGGVEKVAGGFDVPTANGTVSVRERAAFEREFGALPPALESERSPSIVAMTFRSADMSRTRAVVRDSGFAYRESANATVVTDAALFGNTFLRFQTQAAHEVRTRRMPPR